MSAATGAENRHDRKVRLQKSNDRNALITGLFGLAVIVFGFVAAVNSTNPGTGLWIAALGAIALGAGLYFRGRKPRP